jgi:hypothetical protein
MPFDIPNSSDNAMMGTPPPPIPGTEGPNFAMATAASRLMDILPGSPEADEASAAQLITMAGQALTEAAKLLPQLAPILIPTLRNLQAAVSNLAAPAMSLRGGPEERIARDSLAREGLLRPPTRPDMAGMGR